MDGMLVPTFPARGTWIEIPAITIRRLRRTDVPRKGNVDRNSTADAVSGLYSPDVPRKGNVDRNVRRAGGARLGSLTFPARGTWIEMFTRSAAGKPEIDVPHKGNVDRNAVFRHEHDGGRADVPLAGNVDRNMLARCTAASALGRSPLRGTRIEMPGALNRRLYLRRCYLDGAELNMGVICSKRPGVFSGPFVRIFRCFSLRRNPHLWLPRRCGPQPRRLLSARRCWAARI